MLKSCVDYKILEKEFSDDILSYIDNVLKDYESWKTKKYEEEDINFLYNEYDNYYGNGYIIDWYEGLIDTKEFIDEIKDRLGVDYGL